MNPKVYGTEHILYLVISTVIAVAALLLSKKFAKTEKAKTTVLKVLALLLLCAITANRLSQVFRYEDVRWDRIIPDSFCGMTSLVLSLAVLFGKRDNIVFHFVWHLAIFGGMATCFYPAFVGQASSIFYLPTISGLIHHSFSATLGIALLIHSRIDITYKKWYYTLGGFACYITVGAFLMQTFGYSDAYHIAEPIISGTNLTAWVMAPMYAAGYALVLIVAEQIKKHNKKQS